MEDKRSLPGTELSDVRASERVVCASSSSSVNAQITLPALSLSARERFGLVCTGIQ